MAGRLGLKIDVDTLDGLRKGVPALARILDERCIRASFFVALGPDNSGRAIFRVFKQRGFLEKMLRTRAPAVYGLKTMLYGTLLPGPSIAAAATDILPRLTAAGHEAGLHGYDHVRWHDRAGRMTAAEVWDEVQRGQREFIRICGRPARSFAAPGWQATEVSRTVLAAAGFHYASDTRGECPYWPQFGDRVNPLLEIPTTLPTLDELWGMHGLTDKEFFDLILCRLDSGRPQVFTLHAEIEGGPCLDAFADFLDRALASGVQFFTLEDWAAELLKHSQRIAAAAVYSGRLPGRAGMVSRQAELPEAA